ncbi:ras-specific guanine nucleotide-releasing factor 2 [Trichonephila clavipes]|nr:ras-specific guanine nucleotide-releasing factor 2 [Trichonephila clavipes]
MINGRTRLHVVANGTMTGQRYIDEVLLPHVRLFRGAVGDKFVFMDDNATCHRTLAVQDCLDSEGIQRLVWPARSPDLNPIENVWDALGRQVSGRNYPPTNKNTLIRALTEEWDKLPQQLLDNVVQITRSHFESPHLNPQNGVPSISFSAMETGKIPVELESFPYAFLSISSISEVEEEQLREQAMRRMRENLPKSPSPEPMSVPVPPPPTPEPATVPEEAYIPITQPSPEPKRSEKAALEMTSSLPDDPSKLNIPSKKVAPSHSADTLTSQSSNPSTPTNLSTTASTVTLVGSLGSSDSPKPSPSRLEIFFHQQVQSVDFELCCDCDPVKGKLVVF